MLLIVIAEQSKMSLFNVINDNVCEVDEWIN